MRHLKTFENYEYKSNDTEKIEEGIFDSDFKTAMKKWKAAFGYYYENGKGEGFIKTLVKGLDDEFKSNKKFLGTIINTFDNVKKHLSTVGADNSGIGGNKVSVKMPKLDVVAKNYKENTEYYDTKAVDMMKKAGIEITDELKKKLDLKVAPVQESKTEKIQESNVLKFNDFE